jgi:hypothetical protein
MSSLTNNQINVRSMNGLVDVTANTGTFEEVDCNVLSVAVSATVPTVSALSNDTNAASTAFVTNAVTTAGANYVTLAGASQTISSEKTFSNANTFISGNLVTNNIVSASATTDINIGSALTTGDIRLGNSGGATNVALNWGGSSNSGNLSFQGGSFTLAGTGNYNQSGGATFVTNISTTQSSGILNLGTAGARSGAININTGGTSIAPINISSGTNTNAPITIGSTASTTQTCAMDAITTFSKIPSCSVAPTTANHLCNKTYVDSVSGGSVSLAGTNAWTGTNSFNTNLPTSTQTPTTSSQLTTKTYVDSNFLNLTGTQTASGQKTFSNANTYITGNLNAPTITTTSGTSMTIQTDPSGFSDNINMYSANEVTLNSGYSTNINGSTYITQTAGTGLYLTTNGSAGLNFTDNFGGAIGTQFNGTNITFNNSTGKTDFNGNVNIKNTSTLSVGTGTTTFDGGAVDVSGGKLTSGGQFALKSGGADRLTLDHAFGYTYMRIKTAGQALVIGALSDNVNYALQINDTTGAGTYQKSDIFIPDQATFSLIPAGTIMMNVTNSIPNGYLYCNGNGYSAVNVSTNKYYKLFQAIGYTFGGSGSTFNVPNFRGAFLRGESSQVVSGITYSAGTVGTAQAHQLENHKHTYSDMMWWDTDTGGGSGQTIYVSGTDYQAPGGDTVGSNGDGNFSNRLTKGTYPATAINPGTPAQQYSAPTNVAALTGDNTYPMNYSVYYIIKI